jgi:hypothetical protein
MMRRLIVLLGMFMLVSSAPAAQLASVNLSSAAASASFGSQVWLRVSLSSTAGGCWTDSPPTCYQIWYGAVTASSTGSTFTIDPSNNPQFASIAQALANGSFQEVCVSVDAAFQTPSGGAVCASKSQIQGAPMLAGANISGLSLTLNSLQFTSFPQPGGPVLPMVRWDLALAFNGSALPATPVPPTLWLALVGCVCLVGYDFWHRRRKHA